MDTKEILQLVDDDNQEALKKAPYLLLEKLIKNGLVTEIALSMAASKGANILRLTSKGAEEYRRLFEKEPTSKIIASVRTDKGHKLS